MTSEPSLAGQRVVFLGMRGAFSLPPFLALLAAGCDVRAVLVPDESGGAASVCALPPPAPRAAIDIPLVPAQHARDIVQVAWERGVPVFSISRFDESALAQIGAWQPDVLCVACFSRRLPAALLAHFGTLNVHPSLLPAFRGPAPLFWTLRAGLRETGVTVHWMDEGLDTGPIAAQAPLTLPDGISGAQAERLCAELGGRLLVCALGQLRHGTLVRRPQPGGGSSYRWPAPEDFALSTDWSARRAFNFMRGTAEWGQAYTLATAIGPLLLAAAISFDPHSQLGAPVLRSGDEVLVQFSPGVLRARLHSDS